MITTMRRWGGLVAGQPRTAITRAAQLPTLTRSALGFLPAIGTRRPSLDKHLVLGRMGALEVRLASTAKEVRRAQRLRFRVFYGERGALAGGTARFLRRDSDAYDAACDHLLILDHGVARRRFRAARSKVVATCRLLRAEVAERHLGFYSATEYEIEPLLAAHPSLRFLELGRSCVLEPYRDRRTVELLWHGIWAYALRHGIDAMIGCASLEGTDPARLALPLSFLHHYAPAPEEWRVQALPERYTAMNLLARETIDRRAALRALPPLLKGYLRLGARVGDGAVVDHQFGTTDVLVVLPVAAINAGYINYFGAAADRHAAGTPSPALCRAASPSR